MYYGDEIGMVDNIFLGDRNGVRTAMQCSADRNAGFSTANAQRLYFPVITDPEYHYSTVNVETQQANPQSLLWWMKRLIALRKRYRAFGRGSIEFLHPENRKVLAFVRKYEEETILVIANLSRFVQAVELDLSEYRGFSPIEMFGSNEFPSIGDLPYFVTLGPHSFYWFSLEPQRVTGDRISADDTETTMPAMAVSGAWLKLFSGDARTRLERMLPRYLADRRWFRGKSRRITRTRISDVVPISYDESQSAVIVVQVDYSEGDPEQYVLALSFATGDRAADLLTYQQHAILMRLTAGEEEGVVYDALWDQGFNDALLGFISRRRKLRGEHGTISGVTTRAWREHAPAADEGPLNATTVRGEQSNSSVTYADRFILKLFRKLEPGFNPDLEIGRFLTEESDFEQIAPVVGSLEYQPPGGGNGSQPVILGILQRYVPNEGDAWTYTLDMVEDFIEDALASRPEIEAGSLAIGALLDLAENPVPEEAHELIGRYLGDAQLLGQRTAELHLALAESDKPDFKPEASTMLYQRSLYQSMRGLTNKTIQALQKRMPAMPEAVAVEAQQVIDGRDTINGRFRDIVNARLTARRTRFHGDYHLGQVLYTGRDFVIIDFEGEPARTINERRQKRSPLRDVAGMLRSFHYAAYTALYDQQERGLIGVDDPQPERWVRYWYQWTSVSFLRAYFETVDGADFLPAGREEREMLLDIFLLDKAVYELGYELNNRPDWVHIPLRGITDLMSGRVVAEAAG
jgi:maltose alpha-D-glucosyltransferase/alpha-amylase